MQKHGLSLIVWGSHHMHDVVSLLCDVRILHYWQWRRGRAALHIKQKAGKPLSDWKAQVKWSTAAVSSTALPPDWFSWRHPPSRSSFPQPKSSLLTLKWIAGLQPHMNIFSQYQILSITKTNVESLLLLQVQSAWGLLMDLTAEDLAKRFPICTA